MGRLQRKKPDIKKKKKKSGVEGSAPSEEANGQEGNKIIPLNTFSKDKQKAPILRKKTAPNGKSAKSEPGKIDNAVQFLREVKVELKKVTWPSRAQTMGSTVVVILIVMIISLFLGLVDVGLSGLVRLILH